MISRVFFTADTHFGHGGIITMCSRPWSSVHEMDEALIDNWNAVIRSDDTVWHLGDFSHKADLKRLRAIFDKLNGTKHLVIGNHDRSDTLRLPWASKQQMAEIAVDGERLVLLHYAMRVWPAQHRGAIHLFGHSHGRLIGTSVSTDVGVDAWGYCPVTLPEIKQRLVAQPVVEERSDSADVFDHN